MSAYAKSNLTGDKYSQICVENCVTAIDLPAVNERPAAREL